MNDKAIIRSFEGFENARTMTFVLGALVVVAALFAIVTLGFRGRDIPQGAAAMTDPAAQVTQPAAPARR